MASRKSKEQNTLNCGLTLEDDLVLTKIRTNAQNLTGKARDQYLWKTVFKLVCRERAYKTVMNEVGITMDTNMNLFDDEDLTPVE